MTATNDLTPPRFSVRRAAVTVVVAMTVAGVVIGVLWSWVAPAIHGVVALTKNGERIYAHLGNESDHFFIAAFMLSGMLGVMAFVAAVWAWQWRAHRGPVMVAALSIGAAAAAGVAAGIGAVLVHWRYGSIDIDGAPISPEHRVHYVVEAPPVFFGQSPLVAAITILLPATVAAIVYALIAVSTARDDLGAWPPVERPTYEPPPVTAENVLPSAQ